MMTPKEELEEFRNEVVSQYERTKLIKSLGFKPMENQAINNLAFTKLIYSDNTGNLTRHHSCYYLGSGLAWYSCWTRKDSKYNPSKEISFDEVFEELSQEEKDIAIFNLELLR
jgi:hypothetical protein